LVAGGRGRVAHVERHLGGERPVEETPRHCELRGDELARNPVVADIEESGLAAGLVDRLSRSGRVRTQVDDRDELCGFRRRIEQHVVLPLRLLAYTQDAALLEAA